ncbi:polysaccharide biosynthesis/export family protein [Salipiger abyssi]|uniref:polysaccharide biosynthesis/export family protein n=1 Tax=Salipiger abyssi TaxID=1250539 RepID=UPI001A8D3723|nr:polysaccharide biosynthesis/export family protein [Salipiger abyssi]MBN9886287.1 polysaccharide biosynthesis/export family protein [Salipiger abyssi]
MHGERLRALRAACAALLLSLSAAASAAAEEIRTGYELTIHVARWDTISGEMRSWAGWNSAYTVDEEGAILLPILGRTEVIDKTPGAVASRIADGLIEQLALSDLPAVTVSISERPPIMVLGLVRQSGPIEFREGMTVREALAMAGGVPLSSDVLNDPARARLNATALLEQHRMREDDLTARAARLRAVSTEAPSIDFPPMLDSTRGEAIKARELELFRLDADRRQRSLDLIKGRINLLTTEIDSLQQNAVSLQKQLELAGSRLESIGSLSERGLTVASRMLEAQRTYSTIEAQSLDVRGAILAARQDIARAEADRLEIVQGQTANALRQLQDTQAQLEQTRSQRRTQEQIVTLLNAAERPEVALDVALFDRGADTAVEAGFDRRVMPGDILQFSLAADVSGI